MTITRGDNTYRLTKEELFLAYEEQQLLFMLHDVEDQIKTAPEFQRLQFPEKQKAVKSVAKSAMRLIHMKEYNPTTAITLSIETYFKEVKSA
ncbi:MAG: hypothetical protein J6S14_15600 [Clostridia bacterium]|nr:hypothetical protein [Clostridia bacterium]